MTVSIFITIRTNVYTLPILPQSLEISIPVNNGKENVVNQGQVNIAGLPSLTEMTIRSFIPTNENLPFISRNATRPTDQAWWKDLFLDAMKNKSVLIVTMVDDSSVKRSVVLSTLIEEFNYGWQGGDPDMFYELRLVEWKFVNIGIKERIVQVAPPPPPPPPPPPRPAPAPQPYIGATVIVNGRLHADSYGGGPGVTEVNATRVINYMAPGRTCPIHVRTAPGQSPSGDRGWVTAGSVRVV